MKRQAIAGRFLGGVFLLLIVLGSGSSVALGAQTHVFDPVLSLTGGCTTSLVDPVPDPPTSECEAGAHPPVSFTVPKSVTTDFSGNIYVTSFGNFKAEGAEGRIDVFDSEGFFITQIPDPEGPMATAVDSKGNLYVFEHKPGVSKLSRYAPTVYDPDAGKIVYGNAPVVVAENFITARSGVAINPFNDHLFVHYASSVVEFSSAAEGNTVVNNAIGKETLGNAGEGASVAVDAAHGRLYVSDRKSITEGLVRVFELASPYKLVKTFNGATTEIGKFGTQLAITADEGTGHFFVFDGGEEGSKTVHEFTAEGELVSTISYGMKDTEYIKISIDNGPKSPNGALNPEGRYLFVPSGPSGVGHAFAYAPFNKCSPIVKSASFSEVAEAGAEVRATIDPCNEPTSYVFEYTTRQRYEEEGFAGASVGGEGQIPAEGGEVQVVASLAGLDPGTPYRFRVVASNELGSDEGEGEFTTYPAALPPPSCSNDALRSGLAELLPDCRAYELVTPEDTNARSPQGVDHLGIYFATRQASPAGDKVSFMVEGGLLPDSEGTGSYGGDPYLSTRTADGWSTALAGPTGSEAVSVLPGSASPDQGYSFWSTGGGGGSAEIGGDTTSYVRYPDGHSALVGRGSLGTDPRAEGRLITENGGHIVFVSGGAIGTSAVQLEEDAPPDGTKTVYDRTSDETTHVVSLLPGDVTPAAGESAEFIGASTDGRGIAFQIGKKLFLRYDNEETYEIGEGVIFAGITEGGGRIFYVEGGDLYAFDVESGGIIPFVESGNATVVNVSPDGTVAYFASPSVLISEGNPNGAKPKVGQPNLYRSEEGALSFVGTVTEEDMLGKENGIGLGRWTPHVVSYGEAAEDPSRTTPSGEVLLFESEATLSGYDAEGHTQIYLYDWVDQELDCLSCNPTQTPATADASLQSAGLHKGDPEPFGFFAQVTNLRNDGRRAFFQSPEPLVPNDTDGLQDIYEWEAQGVGTCERPDGCLYLISSGHSARIDYLYAVSDSGDDVFFRSSDLLVPLDKDETPSIYDARVNGGFPEAESEPCLITQHCPPLAPSPPSLLVPGSRHTGPSGNVPKTCPKGKRKVKRHGKARCIKKHRKHHRRKGGPSKKGVGK